MITCPRRTFNLLAGYFESGLTVVIDQIVRAARHLLGINRHSSAYFFSDDAGTVL